MAEEKATQNRSVFSIKSDNSLEILAKSGLIPILYQTIVGLTQVNPVWSVLFVTGTGIINAWGEYGQSKTQELVEYIYSHRNEFVSEVIDTDKFKSVLLNVLERHLRETSEEKRKLLRKYLLNVGKGIRSEYNYHTKLIWVLDQITPEEFEVISIWRGRLQYAYITRNAHVNENNVEEHIRDMNVGQVNFAFDDRSPKFTPKELQALLRILGNYGLIEVRDASPVIFDKESTTLHVEGITEFGRMFLEFTK